MNLIKSIKRLASVPYVGSKLCEGDIKLAVKSTADFKTTNVLKKCPRCSGQIYVDHNYKDEAYCISCGYVQYFKRGSVKFLPNPFKCEDM